MSVEDVMHKPLHIPFGEGFDVPPPRAITAVRVQKVMSAIQRAEQTGENIDLDELVKKMGVKDPDNYDMAIDLFGEELYWELLDTLNTEEFSAAMQAMFIWIGPGGSKALAEEFLKDPTKPRSAPNRVERRRTSRTKTSS